jgi:hypothetical protein
MTTMSKQTLISESVAVIRVDIHPIGKEPNNTSYVWSLRSHVRQPYAKSLLSRNWPPTHRMKSWLPVIIWPGRHPGLPHSPSTKPPQSREMRFNKVVTKLLSNPIFMPKPSTHRIFAHDHLFHTHRPKVFTDSQMS